MRKFSFTRFLLMTSIALLSLYIYSASTSCDYKVSGETIGSNWEGKCQFGVFRLLVFSKTSGRIWSGDFISFSASDKIILFPYNLDLVRDTENDFSSSDIFMFNTTFPSLFKARVMPIEGSKVVLFSNEPNSKLIKLNIIGSLSNLSEFDDSKLVGQGD